jgi:hypothetical protein
MYPSYTDVCVYHRPGCGKGYTVAAGDTCDSICAAHALSQAKLLRLNPSLDCGKLAPGQVICALACEFGPVRHALMIKGSAGHTGCV